MQNKHEDECDFNYQGVSGGMEVVGPKEIFRRSVELHGVKYCFYLGDGDSKGYQAVIADQPYGPEVVIEKLECVGHIHKRMGTRLRKLKLKLGKTKLRDDKTIGGKDRLTDERILKIQGYYDAAIRQNDLEKMRKAIWASYFHIGSTNEAPNHGLRSDNWCKYKKAMINNKSYDHNEHFHLPNSIMSEIKDIFKALSNTDLLKKCLHGKSQNSNESLSNVIWSRIPKKTFVSLKTLKFGVYEAVACFNIGCITRCLVLKELGISVGFNCASLMKSIDQTRVKKAEKQIEDLQKKAKLRREKAKLRREKAKQKLEDELLTEEDPDCPSYGAGMH